MLSATAVAQHQSSKAAPKVASQQNANPILLSLEEQTSKAIVFGGDGMLYILNEQGGRYDKGGLSRLEPQAFSRLIRDKKNRYRAQPGDLTEVYVFGREEPSSSFNPESIIAGADGKVYVSGHWQSCARYDPAKQSIEWIGYGAGDLPYGDPNKDLENVWGSCFAATADGLLWCRTNDEGSAGKVFHTRGSGKDLGGIMGTEQWKYAALGADGYLYGATDDALIKVKTDGSNITVLHAFTGKNDHPVGAPILIGGTLFGCAHNESKTSGEHLNSGYIYKLNSDGTGYSTVVKLDYDPGKQPFTAHNNTIFGLAPVGLFTLSFDQPNKPKIIAPTKEQPYRASIAISDNAAYVLWASNQVDAAVFRVPITVSATAVTSSSPMQNSNANAPVTADTATGAATSSSAATISASVSGGTSVFHKRQTADDSQGAVGATGGGSSNGTDESISSKVRPGLPPRQTTTSKAVAAPSPSESSLLPSPSTEQSAPSDTPPAVSASALGGKSVFHKRQSSDDSQEASQGSEAASAGTSAQSAGQGLAPRVRPGLPPRQSKTSPNGPSSSSDSENPAASNEESSTAGGTSSQSVQQPPAFGRNVEGKVVRNDNGFGARQESPSNNGSSFGSGSTNNNSVATEIANQFVQAYSGSDPDAVLALYAETIDYTDNVAISSDALRSQVQEYFARWPVRSWTLASAPITSSLGGSVQQVSFLARYDVNDPQTNHHLSGTVKEILRVSSDSTGAIKIIGQKEPKIKGGSNEAGHKTGRRTQHQRPGQKVYDGRTPPSLPPNIPWPFPVPRP